MDVKTEGRESRSHAHPHPEGSSQAQVFASGLSVRVHQTHPSEPSVSRRAGDTGEGRVCGRVGSGADGEGACEG